MEADVRARGGSPSVDSVHPPPNTTVPSPPPVRYQMKAIAKDSFLYTNKYILRDTRIEVNHSTTPK